MPTDESRPAPAAARGAGRFSRRRFVAILAALAVGVTAWAGSDRDPALPQPLKINGRAEFETLPRPTIRVATFNIHGGKGHDRVRDLDRTAELMRGLDVVGLQEVHGVRSGWFKDDQATILGRKLEMASVFVPTERRWWRDNYGNGVLTRVALGNVHRIPLAGTHRDKFRNAILTSFRHQEQSVQVLVAHVDTVRDHDRQLDAVCHLFCSLDEPALLLGDLNTEKTNPRLRRLFDRPGVTAAVGEHWEDNRKLMRGVDWIIARGLRIVDTECRENGCSDHPLVMAELKLIEQSATESAPTDLARSR